jgi:hypothetical protein
MAENGSAQAVLGIVRPVSTTPLVTDHPGARGRKTFRPAPGLSHEPRGLGGATTAAGTVRTLVSIERHGRVGAALVGGTRFPLVCRHAKEVGRPQNCARGRIGAFRAIARLVAFRHRSHIRERTAIVAKIIVNRDLVLLRLKVSRSWRMGDGRKPLTIPHPLRRETCPARAPQAVSTHPIVMSNERHASPLSQKHRYER